MERKVYTQEQVDNLLDKQAAETANQLLEKFKNYYSSDEMFNLLQLSDNRMGINLVEWFNKNKKK